MSALSNFIPGLSPTLTAGTAIALGQLVELGPDGLAYPCQVSDYATVSSVSTLLAETSIPAGYVLANYNNSGQVATEGQDGTYYVLSAQSSNTGLALSRFSAGGALLGSVAVDSVASTCSAVSVFTLPNGNIGVVWYQATAKAQYAVYGPNLKAAVKAPTVPTAGGTSSGNGLSVCTLAGGGFALIYNTGANSASLTVFDNTGTQQATVSIATTLGSGHFLAQLSNGNIAVSWVNSGTAYFAIYTTAGVSVVAATASVATYGYNPTIAVANGCFAIGGPATSSTGSIAVYNNAGVQQGATYTTPGIQTYQSFHFTSDGTNFWAVYIYATSGEIFYVKITSAGAATTYDSLQSTLGPVLNQTTFDGYGNVVSIISGGTLTAIQYVVFNINLLSAIQAPTPVDGAATQTYQHYVVALGDGAAVFIGTLVGNGPGYQKIIKYMNTAIQGPAMAAAAAGASVTVDGIQGFKSISNLRGAPVKYFDHRSTSVGPGNAGNINCNNANGPQALLQGFGRPQRNIN